MNVHAGTVGTGPVRVEILPPVARFNLRVWPADRAALAEALGVGLPERVGQGAEAGGIAAWCLGPDEWLLHADAARTAEIVETCAAVRAGSPHSLTVISDREITIGIEGEQAVELLSVACPLNLARMAPGTAKRTLFDTAQIVLLRDGPDRFRIEVWRSFASHVEELLHIANAELATGF